MKRTCYKETQMTMKIPPNSPLYQRGARGDFQVKEWQTFVRRFSDMKEGKRELFIKDLTPGKAKYDTKHVIAIVAKSKKGLKKPDILWFRGESGEKYPEPWYLTIEKEMEEWVPGRPWEDLLEILEKREKGRG